MSDYRSLRDALDRGEHEAEIMFGPDSLIMQERERKAQSRRLGDMVLAAITVALWLVLLGEVVLRLGFGIRTLM